jgi:lysophospholipase L1-like esterase
MIFLSAVRRRFCGWSTGLVLFALAACAQLPEPPSLVAGATYVAMGSSYASGPGITVSADTPPNRCARSADNYAHQLARKRDLHLIDVSCGGATTAHILGPWQELPPQIDAVTLDTKLVTVTIGGNDVGFVSGLMTAETTVPDEAAWVKLEDAMTRIAQEVHHRAPQARLIFVDYIDIVPETGSCPAVPLPEKAADRARITASRLAQVTAAVARREGAGLIRASELSRGHDACAKDNWATGTLRPAGASFFVPYHPNLKAMTAIADALDNYLKN